MHSTIKNNYIQWCITVPSCSLHFSSEFETVCTCLHFGFLINYSNGNYGINWPWSLLLYNMYLLFKLWVMRIIICGETNGASWCHMEVMLLKNPVKMSDVKLDIFCIQIKLCKLFLYIFKVHVMTFNLIYYKPGFWWHNYKTLENSDNIHIDSMLNFSIGCRT